MNTIFVGTFKYKEKEFILRFNFEDYLEEDAIWMFTEGNYSCDCNRSMFIRQQFGEDAVPELPCGDTIELLDYHIEHEPYEKTVEYKECFFMHNSC